MSDEYGAEVPRVVIVQCTGDKRDGIHAARDLYDESTYFRKQRTYAEAVADQWFIQSAEYGLVGPDEEIESYDTHAKDLTAPDAWALDIAIDIHARVPDDAVIELLGGSRYADPLTPELENLGYEVLEPLRGERIGARMQRLDEMANTKLGGFA